MVLKRLWRKKNRRQSQSAQDGAAGQASQLATDLPQQKLAAVDAGKTSQGTVDPAKTPIWYLEHATEHHREAERQLNLESDRSKPILFHRQCKYLAEHLGTAIESSRKSLNRSLSPEHSAECRGALKLLCRLAKEVEIFVRECCVDTTRIQVALTSASVPERVSLWRRHLKVCTELLCNSNKLGAAWLTIAQHGGLGEAEVLEIEQMASNDEGDLMRLLESMLGHPSELQPHVLMGNVELVSILLKRLNARQAMPTVGSRQSSFWEDKNGMRAWKVDSKALRREGVLGIGGSSTVYKGEWIGAVGVAIKGLESRTDFERELGTTAQPSHPNVVSFLGYMENEDRGSIILELMDGDLRVLIDRRMQEDGNREGPFSIWEACDMMLQVAEGVRYIHQNRVLHRDLKSSNILVRSSEDDGGEHVCAKLSDFGLSKKIEMSTTYSEQTQNVGTTRWMAPELIRLAGLEVSNSTHCELKHPFKSDVYSFGILCYEILTGELPFSSLGGSELKRMVLDGFRPTLPETVPQSVRNLIKLCWDPEPITRPSIDKICEELRYIRCSLLLEPQDHTPQLPLPVLEPLHLPLQVSKLKGEYSSLKVVRKLGTGGSDIVTVYLSTWLQSEIKHVAQKRFMGSHNECFKNEVSIMAGLEHSNVVRLLYYASDRRSCSIVMELMDEDLHNLMERRRSEGKLTPTSPFSMEDAIHIILQIARGMEYVHGKYVVHRDLKSCNILVKTPSNGGRLEVKVADFGLSMELASRRTLLDKEDSGVGTIRWMAPEVMSVPTGSSLYDPFKSDMFSFGMVCYEILVGRVPFYEVVQDLDKVRKKVLDGERPSLPEWTPSYLRVLIEKCWSEDASERPTFTHIVRGLIEVIV